MIYAYLRYSSENQRDGVSLETQRTAIHSFLSTQPDLRGQTVIERIDEAKSATTLKGRFALAQIRAEVRSGDVIIVYRLDRLARNLFEALKVLREMEDRRVRVLSTCEPAMPLVQHVLLAMSEEFSRQLSDRCKKALDNCASNGFAANKAAYGYRIVRVHDRAKYEVVPEQAAVVKRIFKLRAEGRSLREIAVLLNDDNIPCPGSLRQKKPRIALWRMSCIRAMLKCETYLGTVISGHRKFKKGHGLVEMRPRNEWAISRNAHEAIIDQALWDRVRELDREDVSRKSTPRTPAKYLLSGFLKCAHCGSNLVADKARGITYYGCASGRSAGRKLPCNHRFLVRTATAEEIVLRNVVKSLFGETYINQICSLFRQEIDRARREVGAVLPSLEDQVSKLNQQIETAERRLAHIPEDSFQTYLAEIARMKKERDDFRSRLDTTKKAVEPAPAIEWEKKLRASLSAIERELMTQDRVRCREILSDLISRIEVTSDKKAVLYSNETGRLECHGIPTGI